jgi:hypothetical protein
LTVARVTPYRAASSGSLGSRAPGGHSPAGLADALASRTITSPFTDQDFHAFASFTLARHRRYPVFFAAKHAWVMLLDTLPPRISQALTHHLRLRANTVFRLINRRLDRRWTLRPGQDGATNSLARSPR